MDGFIIFLVWVVWFVIYFIVEFVISIFFTYKIKHVSNDDYKKAAVSGSISTFLFMFFTLLAAYASTSNLVDDYFFGHAILMLLWSTIALATGNYFATISIPKIQQIMLKNKEKKEE